MRLMIPKLLPFFATYATLTQAEYLQNRASLINKDRSMALGSSVELDLKEKAANKILMKHKLKEYDHGFSHPGEFLPAQHFFKAKNKVQQSEVFKIIQKIPKGSLLHCHDTSLISQEYLFSLTYKENLYGCWKDGVYLLHFFNKYSIDGDWKLLSEERSKDTNFNKFLKTKLSLVVEDPDARYPDINSVWQAFRNIFQTVEGLLSYKPVWKEYFYQALKELYEDNVKYVEFRGTLPDIYDLKGNTYKGLEVVELYRKIAEQFMEDYPDFQGVKFIYTPNRDVSSTTVDEYVELCLEMIERYPDFVAGFDLEGQEDLGRPLIDFLPQLLELKQSGSNFFFHSGETNWNGESTDLNLIDAILLDTTRIGHGYAILKHPAVLDTIRKRQIAVEVSPISNQVLKLVEDCRNHPGSIMIANNYPIVITADDPSFWGSKGLSYDWYYAFMGMANRDDDLRFLKQLAINSIQFSTMKNEEKMRAFKRWTIDWYKFIDDLRMYALTIP